MVIMVMKKLLGIPLSIVEDKTTHHITGAVAGRQDHRIEVRQQI